MTALLDEVPPREEYVFPPVNPEYLAPEIFASAALRAEYEETAHEGEDGADPCTYRAHDGVHAATIRLTPDPDLTDPQVRFPHTKQLAVCRCCAFEVGHLYEEMRGECRSAGHVQVELRQREGKWI